MSEQDKLRDAIKEARQHWYPGTTGARILEPVLAAAESTLPKTKMVEVWAVWCLSEGGGDLVGYIAEAIAYPTKAQADEEARKSINDGNLGVHVTGPHMQEVPA